MSGEDFGLKIKQAFHRKPVTKDALDVFNEADHPRGPDGKFGSGGGSKAGGKYSYRDDKIFYEGTNKEVTDPEHLKEANESYEELFGPFYK